jgi:DNA-binding FrmR family transcriptional regulator
MPQSDFDPSEWQTRGSVVRRLRTSAGHLQGVASMVERGADGESVLQQVLAVQAALREINRLMLRHHLDECLQRELVAVPLDAAAGERWVARIISLYECQQR